MSGQVAARLAELGIELPASPTPVAAYVPAVRAGEFIYVSGQLPMVDGSLLATGPVGLGDGAIDPAAAADLARRCAINCLAAAAGLLAREGLDLDAVRAVVKVQGFVASVPGFTGQPAVVDGASTLLVDVFGERGRHARSAVGVAALPLGAPVEIDVVVHA